ncbi:hypothetical protein MHYP_G00336270 [Metynnis hypsauchen]
MESEPSLPQTLHSTLAEEAQACDFGGNPRSERYHPLLSVLERNCTSPKATELGTWKELVEASQKACHGAAKEFPVITHQSISYQEAEVQLLKECQAHSFPKEVAALNGHKSLPNHRQLWDPMTYKLDGIDNHLGELANSVTVIENKLVDIKQDVMANRKCIEEAEARTLAVEEKLDKTESALASATKRLVYLEAKTDNLENHARRKNIQVFCLKEGAEGSRPLLDFVHNMLPKWLYLGSNKSFILERVHRTLAPDRSNHN